MKAFAWFTVGMICTALLPGCASYKPAPLQPLQPEFTPYSETVQGVTLSAKSFDDAECKRYFDRDIRGKGYQPIHISIANKTKHDILFSPDGVSIPVVPSDEVARKVHTKTAGRATAYGVGALFLWPLAVPAVVDGVKSSKANKTLDRDYTSKGVNQVTVQPNITYDGVMFVSMSEYKNSFTVTLVEVADKDKNQKIEFQVKGLKP